MASIPHEPVLDPSTTTILVTGASGYIGSHIVNEALKLGYKVRGTARTQEKCDKTKKLYDNNPNYTTAIVSDYSKPSNPEIEDAVKGVDSVIMVASDMTMSADAKKVIESVVAGVEAFLTAAAKVKSVKRFTLTSSSTAALLPRPNVELSVDTSTWDDEAVEHAWKKQGESLGVHSYPFVVYAASKTEGEKAMWKFMEREKPNFVANAVLPDTNMGRILPGGTSGATGGLMIDLFVEGKKATFLPPRECLSLVLVLGWAC